MSPMNSNLERPAAPAKRRRFARTGLAALLVVTLSAACIPHALALSPEGGQKAANKAVPASSCLLYTSSRPSGTQPACLAAVGCRA